MARLMRYSTVEGNGAFVTVENAATVASVTYECNSGAIIIVEASENGHGNLVAQTANGFKQFTIDRSQLGYLSKTLEMAKNQSEWEKILLSFETTAETKQMGENPKFPAFKCLKSKATIVFSSHRASKLLIFRANRRGFVAREGAFHSATAGITIEKENLPSFNNRLLADILDTKYFQCIKGKKKKGNLSNNDIFVIEIQGNFQRFFLTPGSKLSINPQNFVGMDEGLQIIDVVATADKKEDWLPAGQQYNIVVQAGAAGGFLYVAVEKQEHLDIPERH